MQNRLGALLAGLLLVFAACSEPAPPETPAGTTTVAVLGAIHGQHRRSETYSLAVLRDAIRKFAPDIVLVELPPESFAIADANFRQFGEVRESRADDFPELTDVVFPLSKELGFRMVPVAAWTRQMAADRRAILDQIEQDALRADDWARYQDAVREYGRLVAGRSDDPVFVHSDAYDAAVRSRQQTYEQLFGAELGPGGWDQINRSHLALMGGALDEVSGEGRRVLVLFGAWHKYKINEALAERDDVRLVDAAALF